MGVRIQVAGYSMRKSLHFLGGLAAVLSATSVQAQDIDGRFSHWTGRYVGIHVGAAQSNGKASLGDFGGALIPLDVSNGLFPYSISDNQYGAIGGLTAGYNHQSGNYVFGVEADVSLTNLNVIHSMSVVDPNPNPPFTGTHANTQYQTDISGLATARVRAGFAAGKTLIFASAGLAAGQVENRFNLQIPELGYASPDWHDTGLLFGYAIGAGVEHKFTDRVSVKAEGLFIDLQDRNLYIQDPGAFPGEHMNYSFSNQVALGRVGVNYSF